MEQLTKGDLLKLANDAHKVRASMDEPTKCYYAWMNDSLMQRFNKGKDKFVRKMNQLISRAPVIRCPWDHVGKNH